MRSGKVIMGLLAGFAAGALIGVLFAPDKGTETRRKISKKGEDFANDVKGKFNEFIESMSEKFDKVKSDVTGFKEEVKNKADQAGKDMRSSVVE